MTRLEQFNKEHGEAVAEVERLRGEIQKCEDEAKLNELRASVEKGFEDIQRLNGEIETESKLEAAKNLVAARDEARQAQAPRPADVSHRAYDPSENDLSAEQVEKRDRVFELVIAGEKVSDEDNVLLQSLTRQEKEFWSAMRARTNRSNPIAVDAQERAASTTAQIGTDADGGFTVPQGFLAEVIMGMKDYSPVLQNGMARILNTASGNEIKIPTMDDTANKGAILAEHVDAGYNKVTVGELSLSAYKYTTNAFAVTNELVQDTGVGFERILQGAMSERLGRITAEHFTTGDGSSKPQGVVAGVAAVAARRTVSEADDVVSFDDLAKLIGALDPAYRPNARFMFNSGTELHLITKKVGPAQSTNTPDNRLVWGAGPASGAPASIFGYPYVVNQNMAAHSAANNDAVIFGDFNNFLIRRVRDLRIVRDDSIQRLADQIVFVGFARYDSKVLLTNAFSVLRIK